MKRLKIYTSVYFLDVTVVHDGDSIISIAAMSHGEHSVRIPYCPL